jgi:hypothetical protein
VVVVRLDHVGPLEAAVFAHQAQEAGELAAGRVVVGAGQGQDEGVGGLGTLDLGDVAGDATGATPHTGSVAQLPPAGDPVEERVIRALHGGHERRVERESFVLRESCLEHLPGCCPCTCRG